MRKWLYTCWIGWGLLAAGGCADRFPGREEEHPVSLSADIVGMTPVARTTGVVKETSMTGKTAAVYFSRDGEVYAHAPQAPTYLPFRTSLTYLEGATTVYSGANMTNPLTYPLGGDALTVYCVGLFPANGWKVADDNRSVERAIDGETDLMFAARVAGTWESPLPRQTYRHLLTWVGVTIRPTSPETETYWGKVTSVQLVNPSDGITIRLGSGDMTYNKKPSRLELLAGALPLGVTIQDLGSKLCAPALSYQLIVKTEKWERTVSVVLKNLDGTDFTGDASGKQFIINLYFYPFNVIQAESFLVPWNEQNEDLELKNE